MIRALTENKQRLAMGCWILAGLLLIGFNGYEYMTLEDRTLSDRFSTISSLRQKLTRFEEKVAYQPDNANDLSEFEFYLARYAKAPESEEAPELDAPVATEKTPPVDVGLPEGVVLPTLSGIVQIQNPIGEMHYKALINGRLLQEKDRAGEFTVVQISPGGVVLTGFGRQWGLDSPAPLYASDLKIETYGVN